MSSPRLSTAPRDTPTRAIRATALVFGATALITTLGALYVLYFQAIHAARAIAQVVRGGDIREALGAIPEWARPLMVDISLVTPALIAVTATFVCAGTVALWKGSWRMLRARRFPFPARYQAYYVQMGLLGTIIGFVIAFKKPDLHASAQTSVLLEALSAALWSTLTAVALAYLVCPMLELVMQRLARNAPLAVGGEDVLVRFREHTDGAASALRQLTTSVRALDEGLTVHELLARMLRVTERSEALESQIHRFATEVKAISEEAGRERAHQNERVRELEDRIARLASRDYVDQLEQKTASKADIQHVNSELEGLREAMRKREGQLRNALKGIAGRLERIISRDLG